MSGFWQRYPVLLLLLPLVAFILLADSLGLRLWQRLPDDRLPADTTLAWQFRLDEVPAVRAKTWRMQSGGVLLYLQKDSTRPAPRLGDSLRVVARLRRPEAIGSFDYPRYLSRQGIGVTAYVPARDWQVTAYTPPHGPRHWQEVLKDRLAFLLGHDRAYASVAALSLGWREDLDDDTRQRFQRSGAMHVLAVSGLHTGILMSVLWLLLTGFGLWKPFYEERLKNVLLYGALCALLWFYAALTGWTPSVVRSVVMVCIASLAVLLHRPATSLNSVALAALLILTVRPYDLFSLSFQLSFAAVTAIVLMVQSPWFMAIRLRRNRWWKALLQWVIDLWLISLAAWVGTLPIALVYFGQAAAYFLLTNLLVIPLAYLLVTLTLALLTIGWIEPVGNALAAVVRALAEGMNSAVGWVEQLPGAVFRFPVTPMMAVCMYAFMLCAVLTFRRRNLLWLVPAAAACIGFVVLHYGNDIVI
jgi:competence protein ComEC